MSDEESLSSFKCSDKSLWEMRFFHQWANFVAPEVVGATPGSLVQHPGHCHPHREWTAPAQDDDMNQDWKMEYGCPLKMKQQSGVQSRCVRWLSQLWQLGRWAFCPSATVSGVPSMSFLTRGPWQCQRSTVWKTSLQINRNFTEKSLKYPICREVDTTGIALLPVTCWRRSSPRALLWHRVPGVQFEETFPKSMG